MGNSILSQRDLAYAFAKVFEEQKIPYLLTGSLAASYYGIPRATHDVDFVVEIMEKDIDKLLKAIKRVDSSFLISKEEINRAVLKTSQFALFHTETGIKIDFWIGKNTEFEDSKFKRIIKIPLDKFKINFISPEDLILNKLLWCKEIRSERHLNDCRGILKVQAEKIDQEYLKLWARKLEVISLLEEVLPGLV